ncbi:SOS response-associated peptidase [Paenibacillus sacheonensis]|uniref:Abasic site processing protein n=1 Tax=Paenibacillus sacheonensis TaxID=742054 RepID=A0A7X5BY52_9BACL|nr:SOS response-associated peptidase [Paenibacillus sacheonensis]MBM7563494.1 putative SOS response-associated peptidase YedK [Paenibacillus sacheonensis]NBC71208.1 SOS response-associated peptidase [Paenibacillus sacheonensis]
MCGRYTITVTLEELMLHYWVAESGIPYQQPKYNVAPGQMIPAIINDGEKNKLGELKWGLVPSWAESVKLGSKMLNARSETVWDKPAFRNLMSRKRCIIPADGFYEWQRLADNRKQPMRIVRRDRQLFSMAGLYDTWTSPDGLKLSTCTILTTTPNELMAPIHDRMPVILQREDEAAWLDRSIRDPEALNRLLRPFPSGQLEAYPVAAGVGSVKKDDADCIAPLLSSG